VTAAVVVLVSAGLALALAYGLARGFDALSVVLLISLSGLGALGITVARRARAGTVMPHACVECGGVVSPSAPYCKHCGAPLR
jgi:hypothetical protein